MHGTIPPPKPRPVQKRSYSGYFILVYVLFAVAVASMIFKKGG